MTSKASSNSECFDSQRSIRLFSNISKICQCHCGLGQLRHLFMVWELHLGLEVQE